MRSSHEYFQFVAREKELAALQSAYHDPRSAFWPIYGRRRVGKSELILQFGKSHPTLYLILCGSYIGFMEREVLGKKSPLYGRRTGQIFLKPFGYRDAALFHPHASLVQRATTYFIWRL